MRTWVKGTTPAALLALGVMTLGSGTAFADTSGDNSIGGGNQVNAPISLPIDISGNAAAVAGTSTAASQGGASVENNGGGGIPGETSGRGSVLGGNQVNAPITAPVNACGNALSLFGGSEAGCKGGASVRGGGRGGSGGNRTDGDHSVLGGNQVVAPITAPINACGNSIAIFGDAVAGCRGGASVRGGGRGGSGGNTTSGRSSVLGGNQVVAPITAPVNICGNSVAVVGDAFSGCRGGAEVTGGPGRPGRPGKPGYPGGHGPRPGWHPAAGGNDTDGRFAAGSGNQVIAPITAPVNVCGNAVGNAEAGCKGGISAGNAGNAGGGAGGNRTSGRNGVLAGNQVVAPITAPINICGNAVAVLGKAFAGCKGGASVSSKGGGLGAGGNRTSGANGVLAGNQVVAPITAPINICGNAVAVLGKAEAGCRGGASVSSKGGGLGAGGNRTSGANGVLAGNQVVAPITAPINICGNAVAVLGDAAAGCLGGSHVGGPGGGHHGGHHGYGHWAQRVGGRADGGLVPALPVIPALSGAQSAGKAVPGLGGAQGAGKPGRRAHGAGLPQPPLVGEVRDMAGLPELPAVPGTPMAAQDVRQKAGSPLAPATDLVSSTPIGGALPVGDLGLMSAAQPAGVTGMNSGSLAVLLLGAMAAASAALFATARRIRFGRK